MTETREHFEDLLNAFAKAMERSDRAYHDLGLGYALDANGDVIRARARVMVAHDAMAERIAELEAQLNASLTERRKVLSRLFRLIETVKEMTHVRPIAALGSPYERIQAMAYKALRDDDNDTP